LRAYFDTGLLLKLYVSETNSAQAVALVQNYGVPIIFCQLQQSEIRNSLYRKAARKEIDRRGLARSLKRIQFDLDQGTLWVPNLDWPEVWVKADRLTHKYVLATQGMTLDVLHIAVAQQLEIEVFGTTDVRQMAVAKKAGLKVVSFS
jgi:predicted nucleic acid-binding protein